MRKSEINQTKPLTQSSKLTITESGFTLFELLISLILLGILIAIAWATFEGLMAWCRLNIAISELSQHWKHTRLDATGSGSSPLSLCITQASPGQVWYAQIRGDECETVTEWSTLTKGVSIDTANSTLRTVAGVAGNGGRIYRVSWADTQGGLGGSWGQLGRLVLVAEGTSAKKCLFLFSTDGSWNIREDGKCDR